MAFKFKNMMWKITPKAILITRVDIENTKNNNNKMKSNTCAFLMYFFSKMKEKVN